MLVELSFGPFEEGIDVEKGLELCDVDIAICFFDEPSVGLVLVPLKQLRIQGQLFIFLSRPFLSFLIVLFLFAGHHGEHSVGEVVHGVHPVAVDLIVAVEGGRQDAPVVVGHFFFVV